MYTKDYKSHDSITGFIRSKVKLLETDFLSSFRNLNPVNIYVYTYYKRSLKTPKLFQHQHVALFELFMTARTS